MRRGMNHTARRAGALLGVAVLLGACGLGDGERVAGPGERDDVPCSQVHDEPEEPLRVRAETFGAGREGREAQRTLAETIEARPDCFDEGDLEMARHMREMLPGSDARQPTGGA